MNATLERKLIRIQSRPTLYEIVVECPETGARFALVYMGRWTHWSTFCVLSRRRVMLHKVTGVKPASWQRGDKIADPITGESEDGKTWRIHKSGRTERQALINGELPWVAHAAKGEDA